MTSDTNSFIIKICGVTHPDDAALAGRLGASWIGILFSKKSKRYVELSLAREIGVAAKENGSIPVAVFVDEGLNEIVDSLKKTSITKAQLHGSGSISCLKTLPSFIESIVCIGMNDNGVPHVHSHLSETLNPSHFVLYDHSVPGSGKTFPWNLLQPQTANPWILAGGLNPQNVQQAIEMLKPNGVDVSTGVSLEKGLRKNPILLEQFIYFAHKGGRNNDLSCKT